MPTVPYINPTIQTHSKPEIDIDDPDEEWKRQLRKKISESLETMVKDVVDKYTPLLAMDDLSSKARASLEKEYQQAMANLKAIGDDQYNFELARERNQQRMIRGQPVSAVWGRTLAQEQENIMNTIKNNQEDKAATASPTEERNPHQPPKPEVVPKEPTTKAPPPRSASLRMSSSPHNVLDSKEERDKAASTPVEPSSSARRGSDAKATLPRDQDSRSLRSRRHHSGSHSRGSLPDNWEPPVEKPGSKDGEQLEDPQRSHHSTRSRAPPPPPSPAAAEQPPSTTGDVSRRDVQGRSNSLRSGGSFSARSPPKPAPEFWKPLEDDPSSLKSSYNNTNANTNTSSNSNSINHLGRRGSSTSMKSTGSGTGVRPITIPESIDDAEGPPLIPPVPPQPQPRPSSPEPIQEQEKPRKQRERRSSRKNTRPAGLEADDLLVPSPMRTAPVQTTSVVMQMATSPVPLPPVNPLLSKPSFPNGEDHYYRDQQQQPPIPIPLPAPRELPPTREAASSYPSRDAPPPPVPPNARPSHGRSSYGPDEREFPGGPHPNSSHRQPKTYREYGPPPLLPPPPPPPTVYEERRRDREGDRDWDPSPEEDYGREYERRDRDWDRERESYHEPRHQGHYPYPVRAATYPAPASAPGRYPPPQEYEYEDPALARGGYGYRGHPPTSSPPKDWDYSRPDGTRPMPTRQPSYRREEPERDPYSRQYPSTAGIPVPARHVPSTEDMGGPAWKEWGRSSHDGYARSPPGYDQFAHRAPRYYNGDLAPHNGVSHTATRHSKKRRRPPHRRPAAAAIPDDNRNYDHEEKGIHRSVDESDEDEDERSETEESEEESDEEDAQLKKMEEQQKVANERIQARAAEIQRLQEMERCLEEEARKKDEALRQKEERLRKGEDEDRKRIEEEARKQAEEMMKKKEDDLRMRATELWRKEQDAKRKTEEVQKLMDEAKRKEDETSAEAEKAREMIEKAKRIRQEAERMRQDAEKKEETVRQKQDETQKKEEEIKSRERALGQREDVVKVRETNSRKQEEEVWRRSEDVGKREAEIKRKEKDFKKREEELKWKEDMAKKREEEARQREEDARTREQEAAAKILEERARQEGRRVYDPERPFDGLDEVDIEEQARLLQQAEYRKRAEEIKRNHEERKRQDSVGNESAWAPPGSSPGVAKPFPPQFSASAPQFNAPSPSPNSHSAWTFRASPSAKVPSASTPAPNGRSASSSTVPPANKPRNGSVSSGSQHQQASASSPQSPPPFSESEWARRQAEFSADQQAKFRREQEKMEAERQLRAAGKPLNRDEVLRLMEHHERLWTRLPNINELTWTDFPWPVLRTIMNADEITFILVSNYFQSPLLPEKDKSRPIKDRIKEHLRRWHPDRFESKVLPRVVDAEKEKVKQAAGNVIRCLNDLLRKENETANLPSPFGE